MQNPFWFLVCRMSERMRVKTFTYYPRQYSMSKERSALALSCRMTTRTFFFIPQRILRYFAVLFFCPPIYIFFTFAYYKCRLSTQQKASRNLFFFSVFSNRVPNNTQVLHCDNSKSITKLSASNQTSKTSYFVPFLQITAVQG